MKILIDSSLSKTSEENISILEQDLLELREELEKRQDQGSPTASILIRISNTEKQLDAYRKKYKQNVDEAKARMKNWLLKIPDYSRIPNNLARENALKAEEALSKLAWVDFHLALEALYRVLADFKNEHRTRYINIAHLHERYSKTLLNEKLP